jgi:uncharacterized protein YecT (DUF1311 family)
LPSYITAGSPSNLRSPGFHPHFIKPPFVNGRLFLEEEDEMNRSCKTVFLTTFLTIGLALPAHAQAVDRLDEEQARQLCDAVAAHGPGPLETVTEADRRRFAGESTSCTSFIYGDDEDRDYDQGRRCCLARHCNRELAMIFANGWGVPRDYDAATWFLCRAREDNRGQELNPVELWRMLAAVQEMRTSSDPKDLDYCGHFATSGVAGAYCEGLAMEAGAPRFERRIAAMADSLGPAARAALADLRRAEEAFEEADAELRSAGSRGGSGHAAFFLSEREEVASFFLADLESFGKERAPSPVPTAFQDADRALNAAYQAGKAAFSRPRAAAFAAPGKPLPATLRDAQRAWLRYRNAWIAFYRLRWQGAAPPEALDREIQAALTRQRTAELRRVSQGE